MLVIDQIRRSRETVESGLQKRNWKPEQIQILDTIIALDDDRKAVQTQMDTMLSESNSLARQIGEAMKTGESALAAELKVRVAELKGGISEQEAKMHAIKTSLENKLLTVPNIPHADVVAGVAAEDNFLYRAWDRPLPVLAEGSVPHWELAEKYNLFDMKAGASITGSGFIVYRGQGAKLQRALINYFLDYNTAAGYEEILPPYLVNEASAYATGQLPDKEGQMYYMEKDDLYLIPTAEVPVTNIWRDKILKESDLPVKATGYTPCFRREAGSYGAHVKGLNRVHQFDKVELVRIEKPENSYGVLQEMVEHVAALLESLELPYRILRLCGGDMGFTSAMTYDFEVWSAAQERWLEVSSVSNFEAYQANRMKLRYKNTDNKMELLHTLNGSSLALARIVAALLENHQTPEGIRIPTAVQSYFGAKMIS
ncbi:MAG TPA: serine--tRNA ligase [Saprospiraceae bacterium]|nr:serine--tRNA ligase [Saprospiraceae bacterium]HQW55191.1 serine--tRNA ligase [Saprospiraceae bacterium]